MSSPILLILGAGPNIGAHVAKAFTAQGYRVALASRKPPSSDSDIGSSLHVTVDLTKPETVAPAFETIKSKLGAPPSVVVYNAALFPGSDADDPLANFDLDSYQAGLNVNVTSVIFSLQQAVKGFKSLEGSDHSKTFILTGNFLNKHVLPGMLPFGLTKAAGAYAIWNLAEAKPYEKDGVKFYFADERQSSGAPAGKAVSGPAAAEEYWKLAARKDQGPWLHTFVKGEGYKDFSASE
ncbi:uncharacterized protein A1O9_00907 [Exophiala aquamarina CBS 119918]|uniref:Short-chain dehydrogenase n=1 Tax=Exophiala aquamarina CBS 119918 TaxID=1182545 RepID=A0A072PUA5_9EURO|nr:uncharacterized protein A1O9_00907 [Exophiala aquamarina CBS 119918]KEF62933.1 hypothetical protein A1O9_00907 [Exophiala aquamarina CBS 119918]